MWIHRNSLTFHFQSVNESLLVCLLCANIYIKWLLLQYFTQASYKQGKKSCFNCVFLNSISHWTGLIFYLCLSCMECRSSLPLLQAPVSTRICSHTMMIQESYVSFSYVIDLICCKVFPMLLHLSMAWLRETVFSLRST